MKAKLYRTDGTCQDVEPKDGKHFSVAELQEYVEGYFEFIYSPIGRKRLAVVNETGLLKSLPINMKGTQAAENELGYYARTPLVGNVLIIGRNQVE